MAEHLFARKDELDTVEATLAAADFIVGSVSSGLGAERVATSGTSITVDISGSGTAVFKRAALTGDVVASADSNTTTISNDAVTFAKMQNIATDRLLGRDTASSGDVEEISVGGGLEFTGSAGIQRSALTGDVTASAGSNATTIPNDTVTFAKMQNIATDRLVGRDTAASGDAEEISVGGGIEFTGSAGIQTSAFTGDVTKAAGGTALTIPNDTVTYAKIQDISATDRLLGRDSASAGDIEELTVGGGVEFTGSGGIQRSALTGDVTAAAGSGSTTIADEAVTNAKLAHMAQDTIKGRASGAGTGDATDLTATQATAILNNFVGDSGSGGTKGLVPAPAAGDAAASKFLHADGTWSTPAGAGDVTGPASSTDNAVARFDGAGGKTLQNSALLVADTTGDLSRSGGGGIDVQGTNTNDAAAAGEKGEYVASVVGLGSAITLTNATSANVTSISLTAGDWDVSGSVIYDVGGTGTAMEWGWNTTSATLPTRGTGQGTQKSRSFTSGHNDGFGVGPTRLSLNATTTVYLVAQATFSSGTWLVYGTIAARRVR